MKKSYSQSNVNSRLTEEVHKLLTTFPPTITTLFTELSTIAELNQSSAALPGFKAAVSAGWVAGLHGEPSADLATKLQATTWPDDELHARLLYKGHAIGSDQVAAVLRRGHHITQKHHTPITKAINEQPATP